MRLLDTLWLELDVIEVDQIVVERAALLARRFELRGYDAVQRASAEQVNDEDLVAAAGDQKLLDAWRNLGTAHSIPMPTITTAWTSLLRDGFIDVSAGLPSWDDLLRDQPCARPRASTLR